jgi:hypothetical protein
MGKDGIVAEHPTLKLKYQDPEMARLSLELKEKLEAEQTNETTDTCHGDEHSYREASRRYPSFRDE